MKAGVCVGDPNDMKTQRTLRTLGAVVCYSFLLTMPLYARDNTDVIVMKNGDHLTGQIKGLSAGILYVNLKYMLGTSSVQWSEVARLDSNQLFLVKTENGSVYTGTVKTATIEGDRPLTIEVAGSAGTEAIIERPRLVEMDVTSENFFERFNGIINTGIIHTKANQSTQYSLSSQFTYPRERWGVASSFSSTLSASTGVPTSTRNQLDLGAYRLMRWNNWFYDGVGSFLQSSEQGITSQTTAGGGIGRYLRNTNLTRISVIGGLVGQNTKYEENNASQNVASALIATNLQFFRFDKTNASVTTVLLPIISGPARVKFNMNASYYLKLTGRLSWNASFYGNWDSRPPSALSSSDYGTSSGLSLTFGNK